MGRAIASLLVGVLGFVLLVIVLVPGALQDLTAVGELAVFAAVAGVPGVVLLVVLAIRRLGSSRLDGEGT